MTWKLRGREPTFTPQEKQDAVVLLRRARNKLAGNALQKALGKPSMICHAIKRSLTTQADHDVEPKLQALIKHRLGGAPTLRVWLIYRGFQANVNDFATFKKVQTTRLAWMTALIEEFTSQLEKTNEQTASRPHVRRAQRRLDTNNRR